MKYKLMALQLGIIILNSCASIPNGGVVFSHHMLSDCGMANISGEHNGRYVRITTDLQKSLSSGGAAKHSHAFPHVHEAKLESAERFHPLGTNVSGSAANHVHEIQSVRQDISDTSMDEAIFPRIEVGLYQRQTWGTCVPPGTVVGYVGEAIPDGWMLINNAETAYVRITDAARTLGTLPVGPHSHTATHNHELAVEPSATNALQTFRGETNGVTISLPRHDHGTVTSTPSTFTTEPVVPILPALAMRFIQTNSRQGSLPRGAVIGFAGETVPWLLTTFPYRWSQVLPVDMGQLDRRFISVVSSTINLRLDDHSEIHIHRYHHSHVVTSSVAPESAGMGRSGINQVLSTTAHIHEGEVEADLVTEPASHVPPYTSLLLLIRE